jgi:hypothetical protein
MGHIYLPTPLFTFAARLRSGGVEVKVYDENIAEWNGSEEVVGLACVGSPAIPGIQARLAQLRQLGVRTLIVGGQGVRGFSAHEFSFVFGPDVLNGSNQADLLACGLVGNSSIEQESVSIASELDALTDDLFKAYFVGEVPLYVSQGCRFSCTFCAAQRTTLGGTPVRETYRELRCIEEELRTIVGRAARLGIREISFYLSNLDLMQTPLMLTKLAAIFHRVKSDWPHQVVRFRGLSTTTSFLSVHRRMPQTISDLVDAGLYQIGFGIDGATPDVWRAIRKPHVSENCLRAVPLSRGVYGLTPETLMVFGHDGHDSFESLSQAVDTVSMLGAEFGAIPRPHVAKGLVPGNDGWAAEPPSAQKQYLLDNPWAFQFLDFTCLPTDVTHIDPVFRDAVRDAFLRVCELPGSLTQYVMPEDRRDKELLETAITFNQGRFDI